MAISTSNKVWAGLLLSGIFTTILGLYAIFNPGITLAWVAVLFGILMIAQGINEVIFASEKRKIDAPWGSSMVFGVLNIIFGLYFTFYPLESLTALSYLLIFVILFRSIGAVTSAFELRKADKAFWWFVMAMGILGILLSLILFSFPLLTSKLSVVWIGIGVTLVGINAIVHAFKIR